MSRDRHRKVKRGGGEGEAENVKVAVRVRPFLPRELDRSAKLIVDMQGNQTNIRCPKTGEVKSYAYDHSYWSHDGFTADSNGYNKPDGSKYADQQKVFEDLGQGILENAWEGYNSTLFAYGQTGSGKSYSVIGYGPNKGIVPMFCEKLFVDMSDKGVTDSCEVKISMLEIYNENVRDLLGSEDQKRGLKVREHPKKGFYVEKMKTITVDSFGGIEKQMKRGTHARTIAATNMNETSSRAHTIVGITFIQKRLNASGQEVAKTSITNLVDLAGSERVSKTGATGERLKEGAGINMSLTCLGNCISALADESNGKSTKIPYRDSMLTRLLMNALGGNCKTIMIAAISPSESDFDESVSTLRYADRAKQIKTRAVVNEDPTEKLIRELQEENARLKGMLESGGTLSRQMSTDEEEDTQAQMAENERDIEEYKRTMEEKLQRAQMDAMQNKGPGLDELEALKSQYPHLYNLNADPLLNAMIIHIIQEERCVIGNDKAEQAPHIVMMGPSIADHHAVIKCGKTKVSIEKVEDGSRILVNGDPVVGAQELHHNDRILFGNTQLYCFVNPNEAREEGLDMETKITWEAAQREITAGHMGGGRAEPTTEEEMKLQEELLETIPAVDQANTISEKLNKLTKFEMVLVQPDTIGHYGNTSHIYVRVRNFDNGLQYDWVKDKFMDRFYMMQDMYSRYEAGEAWVLPDDEDPFTEELDRPVRIGCVSVFLKSLAYAIDAHAQLEVVDLRGNEVGLVNIDVVPCNEKGEPLGDTTELWVDNPQDLVGQDLHFMIRINFARGLPPRFTDVYARYRVYNDHDFVYTESIPDTNNPNFAHMKLYSFKPVTQDVLRYLLEGKIIIQLWGIQMPITRSAVGGTTKEHMQADQSRSKVDVIDVGKAKLQMENDVLKRRGESVEQKLQYLREMVKHGEMSGVRTVPVNFIRGMLDAPNIDAMQKWLKTFRHTDSNGLAAGGGVADYRPNAAGEPSKSSACSLM